MVSMLSSSEKPEVAIVATHLNGTRVYGFTEHHRIFLPVQGLKSEGGPVPDPSHSTPHGLMAFIQWLLGLTVALTGVHSLGQHPRDAPVKRDANPAENEMTSFTKITCGSKKDEDLEIYFPLIGAGREAH